MSARNEIIVVEHPKPWVVRMVEGRGMRVADKTLYWWSVHLERFLKFCRSAGAESSEIPEVAARLFLESLPVGGSAQDYVREQARMALDVFIGEMVGWSWGEDRYGRVGPKFRLKANSAGLTTEDTEGTEEMLGAKRFHGIDSPGKSDDLRLRLGEPTDRRASHPCYESHSVNEKMTASDSMDFINRFSLARSALSFVPPDRLPRRAVRGLGAHSPHQAGPLLWARHIGAGDVLRQNSR